jgi:hypothetical protein
MVVSSCGLPVHSLSRVDALLYQPWPYPPLEDGYEGAHFLIIQRLYKSSSPGTTWNLSTCGRHSPCLRLHQVSSSEPRSLPPRVGSYIAPSRGIRVLFFFRGQECKGRKTMEKCIDPPWTRQLRYIVKPALLTKARKSWSINIQPSGSTWSKDSKVGDNMRWWAELRVKTGAFHDSLNQPPPTLQSFRKP